MALLEQLGVYLRVVDPRPRAQIEAEIHEELAFHLEMRTRDNVTAGMDPDAARQDAEQRFGARSDVFAACRKTQLGERIMLQRINFVLTIVLIGFVGLFGWNAWVAGQETSDAVGGLRAEVAALTAALKERPAQERVPRTRNPDSPDGVPAPDALQVPGTAAAVVDMDDGPNAADTAAKLTPRETWLPRFRKAPPGFKGGYPLGRQIAQLPPDEGLAVMREIYAEIPSMEHRRQMLKPFVFHGAHPHATRILHLGIHDSHPGVQAWAFGYLEDFTLRDFSADYAAYEAWWAEYADADMEAILRDSTRDWVSLLGRLEGDALAAEIERREKLDLRPGGTFGVSFPDLMHEAGLPGLIEGWTDQLDDESLARAVGWLRELPVDANYARRVVEPLLTTSRSDRERTRAAAATVIGKSGEPWRAEVLYHAAAGELGRSASDAQAIRVLLRSFTATEDAREIPALISLAITYENSLHSSELDRVLEDRTGVAADETHDGVWWRGWWERNRARLPAAAQQISLEDGGMSR